MVKKRPQIVEKQLVKVNEFLSGNGVKSTNNDVFVFFQYWLMSNDYYKGFNFYNKVKDAEGNMRLVLAGSYIDFDCIQLW